MCWFVTLAVSSSSRHALERLREAHRDLGFRFLETTPTSALFPAGSVCVEITYGGCSCSLYLEHRADLDKVLEKERSHLRKKGWSDAKIQRAIESKSQALARPKQASASMTAFTDVISAIVKETATARLYAHFYSGDQHAEVVPPPATGAVSLQALKISGFPADTIVTVSAAS